MNRANFLAAVLIAACVGLATSAQLAMAEPAPFDLSGPSVSVTVSRQRTTLPIGSVPNLSAGDLLQIHALLPPSDEARYLLVVTFLRGATNPPPTDWFFRCDTWRERCAKNGLLVKVPVGAEQAVVLLAPRTGGDFRTLLDAVRGRPGAFVRASQDLNQALLDRSRFSSYVAALRALDGGDRERMRQAVPLIARSLLVKTDDKCLDKLPELRIACLMQGGEALVLNDGHSASFIDRLTSGPAADLAMEASFTPQARYGYFSPYVASILDIGRIFSALHTAQYQYLPALAVLQAQRMDLMLNAPASFYPPMSVLVAALPAIAPPQIPPLKAVDPSALYCASESKLVLPVDGAPLLFSTDYAHDLRLRLTGAEGHTVDLPARAEAGSGGISVDTGGVAKASLGKRIQGELRGVWGFQPFTGPRFSLVTGMGAAWEVAPEDLLSLVAGRDSVIHLRSPEGARCLERVEMTDGSGAARNVPWKGMDPASVELKLPLQTVGPGSVTLRIHEFGSQDAQEIHLQTFGEPARLDRLELHEGELRATLFGTRLDQVDRVQMLGAAWQPGPLETSSGQDSLEIAPAAAEVVATVKRGSAEHAKVHMRDGRTLSLATTVLVPRPSADIVARDRGVPEGASAAPPALVVFTDENEIAQNGFLRFSLRARDPARFGRDEKIEISTADAAFTTMLSLESGLTLVDAQVAVASMEPLKALGPSAFGALRYRRIAGGITGAWMPLGSLLRVPRIDKVECAQGERGVCRLSGSDLFLIDSLSATPDFRGPQRVSEGFPGQELIVPRPSEERLYVRLRDDPAVINVLQISQTRAGLAGSESAPDPAMPTP